MHGDPILRPRDAAAYLAISRPTLYRWVNEGVLPRPIKLGKNTSGWRRSALDDFITSRAVAA
jgi:excisionase family DNA binding protein